MELVSKILLLIILSIITYQDFKHRAIWWFLIPIAALLQIHISLSAVSFSAFIQFTTTNLIIVSFQLMVLYAYLRFKYKLKSITKLLNSYLGLGDVLFFVLLTLAFSPVNFVLFLVLLLLLSLLGSVFFKSVKQSVPLAGILALGYLLVLASTIFTKSNLFIDLINLTP